jgi:hypothetical protein
MSSIPPVIPPATRPTARDVGIRIAVVTHVVAASHIAIEAQEALSQLDSDASALAERKAIEEDTQVFWENAVKEGLTRFFSPKEKGYVNKNVLDLTEREVTDGTWFSEGIQILLWSVNLISELCPIWEMHVGNVVDVVPTEGFFAWAQERALRAPDQIENE